MAINIPELRQKFKNPGVPELDLIARYASLPEDERRGRMFDAFAKTGLPGRRNEGWRWSDVETAAARLDGAEAPAVTPALLQPDDATVFNLSPAGLEAPDRLPDGLLVHRLQAAPALAESENIPMAALAGSLCQYKDDAASIAFEVTASLPAPVYINWRGHDGDTNFSRIAIIVRQGAKLDLVESYCGGASLASTLVELKLEDEADVRRSLFHAGDAREIMTATGLVELAAKARFSQTILSLGSLLSRFETRLNHTGSGSHAVLNAAYLCAAQRHCDITSVVRHGAPSCVTRQMTKGAVLAGGRGVFQGKFLVPRTIGQFTDADMQHQALLLENGAEVFAKPELEIYADDVECAHGNTSGALDEEQLFYMRQRGIPLPQARALLTEAFVSEALSAASPDVGEAMQTTARAFLAEMHG